MAFAGADFEASRTPVASNALRLAAKKAVNQASQKSKNLREFAAQIKSIFEASNGHGWHILAGSDFAVDIRYRKSTCVVLSSKKSKLKVLLYRTTPALTPVPRPFIDLSQPEPPKEEGDEKRNPNIKNRRPPASKIVWFASDMTDEFKTSLIDSTESILAKLQSPSPTVEDSLDSQLAGALKQQLSAQYGHTWHAIVSTSRDLCCLPLYEPGSFADFAIGSKFRVVVYRHSGADVDTRIDMTQFGYRATLTIAALCLVMYSYFTMVSTERHATCSALDQQEATGCSEEEVASARVHHQWKTASLVALVVFTVAASFIRMYRRVLRSQLKHG